MLQEFESSTPDTMNAEKHHEQTSAMQNKFQQHMSVLLDVFSTQFHSVLPVAMN